MNATFDVSVEIHQAITNGWRLKVTLPTLGMYINGFRAYPSKKEVGAWAIYPPSQKVGSRFVAVMEFDKSMPLWDEIERAAKIAVLKREEQEAALEGNQQGVEAEDVNF